MASGPATGTFKKRAPGILFFFSLKQLWISILRLLKGGVFFSVSYLLNFVTQYYVKEQIENQCFKLSRCLALFWAW